MQITPSTFQRVTSAFALVTALYHITDKFFGTSYIIAMADHGLSSTQIGIACAISALTLTVADYPSGNIADCFGRKKTGAIGFLVWGAGLLIYAHATSFGSFLIAMIVWGIGAALISGTPEAWFVDQLEVHGWTERRHTLLPTIQSIALLLSALFALTSIWFLRAGSQQPILVAGWIAVITGISMVFLMEENYGNRQLTFQQSLFRNTRDLLKDRIMRLVLLKTVVGFVAFTTFVFSWQFYVMQVLKLPYPSLGFIMSLFIITMSLGNALSIPAMRRFNPVVVSIGGVILTMTGLLLIGIFPTIWGFALGALGFELGFGLERGASTTWVHDVISKEQRASFLSAISMVTGLTGIGAIALVGYLLDTTTFQVVWFIGCAACVLALIIYWRVWFHFVRKFNSHSYSTM